MGIGDPLFLGSIRSKLRSWIADLLWVSCSDYWMSGAYMGDCRTVCPGCRSRLLVAGSGGCRCRRCRGVFCPECMFVSRQRDCWKCPEEVDVSRIELCRFCFQAVRKDGETGYVFDVKWERTVSPKKSFYAEGDHLKDAHQSGTLHLRCSTKRNYEDDDEDDDYGKSFLSPSSIFSHDISDLETSSFSTITDFYSFKSSPLDSPNRADQQTLCNPTASQKTGALKKEAAACVRTPRSETEDLVEQRGDYAEHRGPFFQEVRNLDNLERDNQIWIPPPPRDAADDMEVGFFRYDDEDEDEDDGVAGTGHVIKSCSFDDCTSAFKDRPTDDQKELLRDSVHGHFKALVSQMLIDEGMYGGRKDGEPDWLGIVSSLAWQAANFVKPDTSREGSMDPSDYVKVKCVQTGGPNDSSLVKGIVCTRNVRHKRMVTQHKNPRLLLIGGELEFQKVPHKLSSMNSLIIDQKSDHLDMAFSKIETLRPNVLLVEKSVCPDSAQYMLSKGISLVTNVKRTLLQRIAKCTGARITESMNDLPSTRLGTCEAFYVNRVSEECLTGNTVNRKSSKTLMFFDGCPRRLGCTILLKGQNLEELRKVKRVVHFATFAAYHLSLETSFLADEGATLHTMQVGKSFDGDEFPMIGDDLDSMSLEFPGSKAEGLGIGHCQEIDANGTLYSSYHTSPDIEYLCSKVDALELPYDHVKITSRSDLAKEYSQFSKIHPTESPIKDTEIRLCSCKLDAYPSISAGDRCNEANQKSGKVDEAVTSNEFSTAEKNQSILVFLSKSSKGMICGGSQLLRIKFYGSFDKPLGRYLHENLFDQASCCDSCKEPVDSHVICYTHQHGSLTINVKRLPNVRLPGERDGRIWMWHRCLKCASKDGFPPAARRVVMSDAAWGLSFGKFLELSFSSHTTANRLASCGHSLQRDCLRFYGFGNMVAFFRYAPVDILSVHLPPSMLDFSCHLQQKWLQDMTMNVSGKMENLHEEVLDLLYNMAQKILTSEYESIRPILLNHISDLKDLLKRERSSYDVLLHSAAAENSEAGHEYSIVLELNCFRRSLLIDSYMWDRRLFLLDSMLKARTSAENVNLCDAKIISKELCASPQDGGPDCSPRRNKIRLISNDLLDATAPVIGLPLEGSHNTENLSDKIDLAWTGSSESEAILMPQNSDAYANGPHSSKVMPPQRFYSFDSTFRTREQVRRLSSDSRHFSSFNTSAYADLGASRETSQNFQKVYPTSSRDIQKLKFLFGNSPSFISSASRMATDGARLLLPQADHSNTFVAVYDDEPSSIISYALSSKEHAEFVARGSDKPLGWNGSGKVKDDLLGCQKSVQPTMQSLDFDDISFPLTRSEDNLPSYKSIMLDPKQSHFRFVFDDESSFPSNKAKFSITCYFARQFSALRKKCCPSEMDFIRSLSRCKKWSAEGGKSNAYFARSFDERFIIKQVTRTEMESFEEFAPQYFTYLTESINSGSPTCLAKILGIFQVTVKHMKGGREVRTDLMVMENLFYGRNISTVYDLKGSRRSRYISDTNRSKKVLLDLNLIEILQTKPIFLGSRAKRKLERAIWNDTAFLASIDVMDYSLLVGIDDERKELVIGIIDFMRQYTWDKHLETWVKASGILGGPKDATPTIISPKQYKKRFRKAMSGYFLTVPDQWPS